MFLWICFFLFIALIVWLLLPEKAVAIQKARLEKLVERARSLSDEELLKLAKELYSYTASQIPDKSIIGLNVLEEIAEPMDQVRLLISRLKMPYGDILYTDRVGENLAAELDAGAFIILPFTFHFPEASKNTTLVHVASDQSYAYLDHTDAKSPKLVRSSRKIITKYSPPKICINPETYRVRSRLMGAVCHEVAHLFLFHCGYHPPRLGGDDNEVLKREVETDICTILFGCENYMLADEGASYLSQRQFKIIADWLQNARNEPGAKFKA